MASCRPRCRPSRCPSLTSGASAWSPRHCRCRLPSPTIQQHNVNVSSSRTRSVQYLRYDDVFSRCLLPFTSPSHPLVGAPAAREHEDVVHLALPLLLLQLAPLVLGDDVLPVAVVLVLQLRAVLLHVGEVGHLPTVKKQRRRRGDEGQCQQHKRGEETEKHEMEKTSTRYVRRKRVE